MIPTPLNQRQEAILTLLTRQKSAAVVELSEALQVSPVTIRTDLNVLAELGRVERTHGGARIANERTRQEFTFATRRQINAQAKVQIGTLAASLVQPTDAILLDASTTSVAVGQALKHLPTLHDITAVTTGIWTALELLGSPHINVVLAGGHVRNTTGSITGSITNQVLNSFTFQKVFVGAWGVDPVGGITDIHLAEVELKQAMIERAAEVIVVADGSKFGRIGLAPFAQTHQITTLITDNSAPQQIIDDLRGQGVQVLVAQPAAM